jgi:predicted RND superfamily exporter protein
LLKFGRSVAKNRWIILVLSIALLLPSVLGMAKTRINYDMLDYLPSNMETVKGQDILMKEFGKGAFSFVIVEGMQDRDVAKLKTEIEAVDHVDTVLWYDSYVDLSVPKEALPDSVYKKFNSGDTTLLAVFFDTSTSADATMEAVKQIRNLTTKQVYVSGMSALVTDLKAICEKEEPIYVTIAIACACAAMMLTLDNWLAPLIFLICIGITVVYNMGTNFFLGEISYITKALAAVLQLAVTMDYSIFLWHSFEEQKTLHPEDKKEAMAQAIAATITSVTGSSITTIAGFVALCFMSYTMGMDLGTVMAKGVLLGVIGAVTILPAFILIFDKPLEKLNHKSLLPRMDGLAKFITKHYLVFLIAFVILLVPAIFGYKNMQTYYDFTNVLTSSDKKNMNMEDLQFLTADEKLTSDYDISTTEMVLCDADLPANKAQEMLSRINKVDGVMYALGLNSVLGPTVPEEMAPQSVLDDLKSDNHQLILINSSYKVSTDEVNKQCSEINTIIKEYDPSAMLIGEAPCTKDLISVTNKDFGVVDTISIVAVFVIILLVLKSISLPFILVAVIELAIFINLGIPYYTNVTLPFIAPICISTIQLGATVDYAILMTTRYKQERLGGCEKHQAIQNALTFAVPSIIVSALGFFAATFGVALYSNVDIVSSMCNLVARGAIVSMLSVIFVLPAMLMLLDKLVCATTLDLRCLTKKAAVKKNKEASLS